MYTFYVCSYLVIYRYICRQTGSLLQNWDQFFCRTWSQFFCRTGTNCVSMFEPLLYMWYMCMSIYIHIYTYVYPHIYRCISCVMFTFLFQEVHIFISRSISWQSRNPLYIYIYVYSVYVHILHTSYIYPIYIHTLKETVNT